MLRSTNHGESWVFAVVGWFRRDKPDLEAQAAVHDYGEEIEGLRPQHWSDAEWGGFWSVVGSCGTRSCDEIIADSADCGGIVFSASHAWAETVADAPTTILHRINGQWECVAPDFSDDAATVYRCLDEVHPDTGHFEDLVYRAAFGMGSTGVANAFTYKLNRRDIPDDTTYYQVVAPGSIKPVTNRSGSVTRYNWQRSRKGSPIPVQDVKRIVWPDPAFDFDPMLVWKPACKWIELYDNMCALLDIQVKQNSMGGLFWVDMGDSAPGTESQVAQLVKERFEQLRNGKMTTNSIVAAGRGTPSFIEPPDVQGVIFDALPIIAREIGRLGPIELGSLADGEVSGTHWAAAFRDRHNIGRLVGPMRKRVDRNITRWALTPKLEALRAGGQFESSPSDWALGHDLDAIAQRTDNITNIETGLRLGTVSPKAHRRAMRLKESDRPSLEELELLKCMVGRSPAEIADFFGEYDDDRSDVSDRRVGVEVFGPDPGPDSTSTVPAPVQRAAAAADPYGSFQLAGDRYEGAFAR